MPERDYRKSTVVSVAPFPLNERKHTVIPSDFSIPPAAYPNGIEILIVSPAITMLYLDADRGSTKVPIDSWELANSIVNDYVKTVLSYRPGAGPGFFALEGDYTIPQVEQEQRAKLVGARDSQKRWFQNLVRLADDDWAKYRQHRSISEVQRIAAKSLSLQREWITSIPEKENLCPVCRDLVDPLAIMCKNCKFIINEVEYRKVKDRFVQV